MFGRLISGYNEALGSKQMDDTTIDGYWIEWRGVSWFLRRDASPVVVVTEFLESDEGSDRKVLGVFTSIDKAVAAYPALLHSSGLDLEIFALDDAPGEADMPNFATYQGTEIDREAKSVTIEEVNP
jgi:hypothetical protein